MGIRIGAAALCLALAALVFAPPALASGDAASTTTTGATASTTGVAIGDGFSFTGATITSPGQPDRAFTAYQAAVFVQSWLPAAFYGTPTMAAPPADLPVYRLDIAGNWGGPTTILTAYFAEDGKGGSWLSFPQPQTGTTETNPPPPPANWWIPPPRTLEAFHGTAKLEETLGTYNATSTTASALPAGSDSGSSSPWVWVLASVAVVAVGAFVVIRRRRQPVPEA
jgi:hypothetical protein